MNQIVIRGEIASNLNRYKIGNENYMSFSIAVECKNRKTGKPEKDFMNCESWGRMADCIFSRFDKGDNIVVIGELRTRTQGTDESEYLPRIVVSEACFTCGLLAK